MNASGFSEASFPLLEVSMIGLILIWHDGFMRDGASWLYMMEKLKEMILTGGTWKRSI